MRIKHVAPIIVKRYLNPNTRKRTLFLRGKSGIGKTAVLNQASDVLAKHIDDWQGVIPLHLADKDPTDVRGVPVVEGGITKWARPDFFPTEGSGILFLDEITSAPQAIQAVAYQITHQPELFGIPSTWMVVAAGNNKSDRGVTFNLAAPLQNRMCDVTVETTLDDFTEYAVTAGLKPEILSFLRDRPDLLHKFEPSAEIRPFPSPRSWFAVNDTLDLDVPSDTRLEMVKGDVGEEAAITFEAHLRVYETAPRIDDILNGKSIEPPTKLDVLYCVAMGLAVRIDEHNVDAAWEFIGKLGGEIQSLIMKLAYKRCPKLSDTAAFGKWAVDNQAAFSRV